VRGGPFGVPMIWHISVGTVILALIVARFLWRVTHPVTPDSSFPSWQRIASVGVHWSFIC
jgi:cytochrome b561